MMIVKDNNVKARPRSGLLEPRVITCYMMHLMFSVCVYRTDVVERKR